MLELKNNIKTYQDKIAHSEDMLRKYNSNLKSFESHKNKLEKQKIDLALLFTWREVAQLKNSVATNLLILDEVFDSSLDQSATDELMKILKNKLDKTNLFVISHKGEVLIDRFDKTVEFKKDGDFSNLHLTNA